MRETTCPKSNIMCGRGLCEIYGWEEGKDISKLSQCGEQSEHRGEGGAASRCRQASQQVDGRQGRLGSGCPGRHWEHQGSERSVFIVLLWTSAQLCTQGCDFVRVTGKPLKAPGNEINSEFKGANYSKSQLSPSTPS